MLLSDYSSLVNQHLFPHPLLSDLIMIFTVFRLKYLCHFYSFNRKPRVLAIFRQNYLVGEIYFNGFHVFLVDHTRQLSVVHRNKSSSSLGNKCRCGSPWGLSAYCDQGECRLAYWDCQDPAVGTLE